MLGKQEHALASAIRRSVHPLTGENTDFDPLLKTIGDSRFVLIGDPAHRQM
jgi:erythromycin esterase-like protein